MENRRCYVHYGLQLKNDAKFMYAIKIVFPILTASKKKLRETN